MDRHGLGTEIVDPALRARVARRFGELGIALPTFEQLADPSSVDPSVAEHLRSVDPDAADPLNLFRVHWFNAPDRRGRVGVPDHVVLPTELTGVDARIVVALGDRFPMIRAHKVLAAYGCLAPRLVTGAFDPTAQRAVWPSTGNYCRGGVAISRILGCRGVAVLPEGMSRERFTWLERWVADPADIVRTPGSESNVKEIYDTCADLARDERNVILNQFSEFGNHLVHVAATGPALGRVYETLREREPELRLSAFVSASGSAGTLGAGDHLKDVYGARIVAVEALECPTMLRNGYGSHNIQGIGDKHVPLIHNVMNTDVVVAVSDRHTDRLNVLFNTDEGRALLSRSAGVGRETLEALGAFGLSSICNVLAAIKVAKRFGMGQDEVIVTVATDGAAMYASEIDLAVAKHFPRGFDDDAAAETFGESLMGMSDADVLDCTQDDRERIFNLGYFTWVEQQGVPIEDFESRRSQAFWRGARAAIPAWDALIRDFNAEAGLA